jgi:NAD-dependent SIR2 family protein deacetylase
MWSTNDTNAQNASHSENQQRAVARAWIDQAEHALIGAGAGLSVAAGIDYTDPVSFAHLFPAFVRKGFTARYQMIGNTELTPEAHWGYWATHVRDVRFTDRISTVYQDLRGLVGDKEHFVVTSNVDGMFYRHGFDSVRCFTPQGDYAAMQCMTQASPECRDLVWESRPIVDRLLSHTNASTQEVMRADLLPRCPQCDGEVFLNVRVNEAFVESPYAAGRRLCAEWISKAVAHRLLILEIGAGFNTPSVVRWPMEALAAKYPNARFIRINPHHAAVPPNIAGRSVALRRDAGEALDLLLKCK